MPRVRMYGHKADRRRADRTIGVGSVHVQLLPVRVHCWPSSVFTDRRACHGILPQLRILKNERNEFAGRPDPVSPLQSVPGDVQDDEAG